MRILAEGLFAEDAVELRYDPAAWSASYDAGRAAAISEAWARAEAKAAATGGLLYNGPAFRLGGFEAPPGRLVLRFGDTDYRDFVGTRDLPEGPYACPVGAPALVVTSDGLIPLGRRAPHLEYNPGTLFCFGGMIDREADWRDGRPDLWGCVQRELEEELGLPAERAAIRCLGLLGDERGARAVAPCVVRLEADRHAVEGAGWREELSDLFFIPLDGIAAFRERHDVDSAPSLRLTLELAERRALGWLRG